MTAHIIINHDNNGIYNGVRQILGTPVVDWSDHKNPDLQAIIMTEEHAKVTKGTLIALGYENVEILIYAPKPKIMWGWYCVMGTIAAWVGFILANMLK